MVQRKEPNKFLIRSEPVKPEKRAATFKQTCIQHPDAKNRGSDLKKKMKRTSMPIQLSDLENLTSSPIGKNEAQPGKPPPPAIRSSGGSPNYMKSTSCFDARREVSQVSARKIQLIKDDNKNTRRSSGINSVKPAKCLTKLPSFKLVRTPSFKATRGGALKKSARATCSSTLKDSKFPPFLLLSNGGTESEGTSAMKVCPYTYCSLNGHRHAPLPPLKGFLSARRRLLKTQKSFKSKEGDAGIKMLDGKMASEDLGNSASSSLDFFIEIYAENKKSVAESVVEEEGIVNEAAKNEDGKQFQENMYGELLGSEEEIAEGSFFDGSGDEDDAGSTDAEMEEWEQQFLSLESDDLDELEDQADSNSGDLSGKHWHDGELSRSCDVFNFTDEVGKGFSAETGDFEEQFCVGDSELQLCCDREVEESSQASESLSYDQVSYTDDAFDDMDSTQGAVEKAEIECEELILNSELESQHSESICVTQANEEAPSNEIKDLQAVDDHLEVADGECAETNEGFGQFHHELPDPDLTSQEEISNIEEQDYSSEQDDTDSSIVLEVIEPEADGDDTANNLPVKRRKPSGAGTGLSQEPPESGKKCPENTKCKKLGDESEDPRDFNPREPNYLPLVPDPEAEKVDLKHQLEDDRKNAEEWMLDYALQRTVTQLAPARKKKVALLVEAFESVMPTSKCETHLWNTSGAFTQAKPIQACF